MKIREIIDDEDGRKWEIYKKSDNEYFYKYYEYFKQCGWRFTGRTGDHVQGYLSKEIITDKFDILV